MVKSQHHSSLIRKCDQQLGAWLRNRPPCLVKSNVGLAAAHGGRQDFLSHTEALSDSFELGHCSLFLSVFYLSTLTVFHFDTYFVHDRTFMTISNTPLKAVQQLEAELLKEIWERSADGRLPQAEFGETFGIGGQSAVANFLHGRSPLSPKAALGFARGLSVPLKEFSPRLDIEARGIASTLQELDSTALKSEVQVRRNLFLSTAPLLGELKKGLDGNVEEVNYGMQADTGQVEFWSHGLDAYAMRVRGDVFFPRYRAGEFLILSGIEKMVSGVDVLVAIDLGPRFLKQWNWTKDGEVQLLPLAGESPPMTIPLEDISEMHRVLAAVGPDALRESLADDRSRHDSKNHK